MHVEFSWYLYELLQQVEGENGTQNLGLPETTDCPEHVSCVVSSPVAFERAKGGPSFEGSPRRLAEAVIEAAERGGEQWFVFSIGGQGHINANPNSRFIEQFLSYLLKNGPASLLSEEPFLFAAQGAQSAKSAERSFSSEDVFRRAEKLAQQNPDIKELLSRLNGSTAGQEGTLMLLGLMGDAELEARPYLEGLCGRQNLPWYCNRFRHDASRCVYPEAAQLAGEVSLAAGLFFATESPREAVIRRGLLQLFDFRRNYFSGVSRRRPELSLLAVLRLVRTFYSAFNDPDARAVLVDPESPKLPGLRLISFILSGLAVAGLNDLEQRFTPD